MSQIKNIPFLTHIFTADLHPNHFSIQELGKRGIAVFVCAGMNETSSVFAVNLHNYQGKDIAGKIIQQENNEDHTIGKPLPGVAVKVCDENMNNLYADEYGTLWIKGACVAQKNSDDQLCRPFLHEGWFNSGMTGCINTKGFIKINHLSK